jgi:hypothetical protein
MRYEDILGHTSDAAKCKWFTMSWQWQNIETECLKMIKLNTCLETPDTYNSQCQVEILFFVRRHSVVSSTISLQNKVKKRRDNWEMPLLQCDNTLQRSCAIFSIGKIAIRGLFSCLSQSKSVSRVKQHSGSDFCSLLPGNSNALPIIWRPNVAEHFPTTRIAIIGIDYFAISRDCPELYIECKMAILLLYLCLLYAEKKQIYKLLNTHENARCDSEIGNVSFA